MNNMIHSSSIISTLASIGKNVQIAPFCIIHDNVVIGDNTVIDSYCELGITTPLAKNKTLYIGANAHIRSYSSLYQGSVIGKHFNTGHYVTVRENSDIGNNVQLGSRGDIQGDCCIGNFTKMHADVHIGKGSKIGNYVWMFPEVLLTNDPTPPSEFTDGVIIEDYVVLAAKVLIFPGVRLCKDSVIAAGSVVKTSVPAGKLVTGNPSKIICDAKILRCKDQPNIKAYPWRYRFHRGYIDSDIHEWLQEAELILNEN